MTRKLAWLSWGSQSTLIMVCVGKNLLMIEMNSEHHTEHGIERGYIYMSGPEIGVT